MDQSMTSSRASEGFGRRLRALLAIVVTGAVVGTGLTVGALPASADTPVGPAPIEQRNAQTVTADALPTVQIDSGVVWAQVINGNTVYAGGSFSKARPAGATAGQNTFARSNILAYDINTGVATSFAPVIEGTVKALAVSPDGTKLYVGGSFTKVDGQTRHNFAAFDTATGALLNTVRPAIGAAYVNAIVATNSVVYVGGLIGAAGGITRKNLAAVSATNGAVLGWAPTADLQVDTMVLAPAKDKLIIGGRFGQVNGAEQRGLAALDLTNGALLPWAAPATVRNGMSSGDTAGRAGIWGLTADSSAVYGTGWVFSNKWTGNLEGMFAAEGSTGDIRWIADCHGDHYGIYSDGTNVYSTNHVHDCQTAGSAPQSDPSTQNLRHATAWTAAAKGTLTRTPYENDIYANWEGYPAPAAINWFPDWITGTASGQGQAGWTATGNGTYLLIGGEFPFVNGQPSQGIARFSNNPSTGAKQAPRLAATRWVPSARSVSAGTVRVVVPANWDRDDLNLTYELWQQGVNTPIATTTGQSTFWNRPNVVMTAKNVPAGATRTYYVIAKDANGNTARSASVTVTASSAAPSAYAESVLADGASLYWRLGGAEGGADWAGTTDAVLNSGVTSATDSALANDTTGSAVFNGADSGFGVTSAQATVGSTYATEIWVKTNSTSGGKLMGYGSQNTGTSGSYDRHTYMGNDGRITFGAYPGYVSAITSPRAYNDNKWHHVVSQQGPTGMQLFVDGTLVASNTETGAQTYPGYWRIGGDNTGGWPNGGNSNYLAGQLDEFAVYPNLLTPAQIQNHTTIGRGPVAAPVANIAQQTAGLTVSFDGTTSTSDDRTSLIDYAWDFGDGTTSTEARPTHRYSTAGTYTATLVVTDDLSVTSAPKTVSVTVGAPANAEAAYTQRVLNDGANLLWRLGGTNPGNDWAGSNDAVFVGGSAPSTDTPFVGGGDGSTAFDGNGGFARTDRQVGAGDSFATEIWFNTTSTSGGKLLGYGDGANGDSGGYDRHLYMTNDGRLVYGIYPWGFRYIESAGAYNDGQWHHVVAQLSNTNGIQLYVDGELVAADRDGTWAQPYTGYWRIGGDNLNAWPGQPNSFYFGGKLDQFAVYGSTLTPEQVRAHFQSGTAAHAAPTVQVSHTETGLTTSVDGAATTVGGSAITGWNWSFGDGATASTSSAVHRYGAPGTYEVTLTATDDLGAVGTTTTTVTVTDDRSAQSLYTQRILSDGASLYYSLGGSAGGRDLIGANDATFVGGTGASTSTVFGPSGNGSATFDGVEAFARTTTKTPANVPLSTELWFNTTSTSGGKLVGYGDATNGTSGNYDRHLYMDDRGHLNWGAWTGQVNLVTTDAAYNDGQWHHVVAQIGSTGMQLYVDGVLVGSNDNTGAQDFLGYWRIGGDGAWGWPNQPSSQFLNGKLDEFAVYPRALTSAEVGDHYSTGLGVAQPTAAFTATGPNLDWSFDASASTAPEGRTIASYAWNFGDGSTATTKTATHTYASAGERTVTLTVMDSAGRTSVKTQTVNAVAPHTPPTATIIESTSGLTATFDGSTSTANDGATVTGYAWDFGDGTTSIEAAPVKAYGAAGTYTVSLVVTDSVGAASTAATRQVTVTHADPTVSFAHTESGLTVSATATAAASDGATLSYSWNWGDGSAADTTAAATHRYAAAGTYEVTVTVTDSFGAAATSSASVTVAHTAPVASFTNSVNVLTVAVDASASTASDGATLAYSWNWGDGSAASSGPTASHSYVASGTYTVTLTLTDSVGAQSTKSANVTVTHSAPVAAFTSVPSALAVSVDASATTASDGASLVYSWNWGDATPAGNGRTASHTYAAAGNYEVTLTATDSFGFSSTTSQWVTVTAETERTVAKDDFARSVGAGWGQAITGGNWNGTTGFSVANGVGRVSVPAGGTRTSLLSTASAKDLDARYSLAIDKLANGGGAHMSFVVHKTAAGQYSVKLRTTSTGAVVLAVIKTVGSTETVIATRTVPGLTAAAGSTFQVRFATVAGASSTTLNAKVWADGTSEPAAWTVTGTDSESALQGAGQIGFVNYLSGSTTNGPLVVSVDNLMVVTGQSAHAKPVAAFTSQATGRTASFSAASSTTSDGATITGWSWNFGDGTTSTEAAPVKAYGADGTYTVSLTVTDSLGATSTAKTGQVTVAHAAPTAAFTSSASQLAVSFNGGASTATDGASITGWTWNWGDGSADGSGAQAQHAYGAAGTYSVTLTVTDSFGAQGSTVVPVTVSAAPQPPQFVAQDDFERSVASGWGTSPVGGAWTTAAGFSVANGVGTSAVAVGGTRTATLNAVAAQNVDARVSFSTDRVADGGGLYVSYLVHRTAAGDYRVKVRQTSTGAVTVSLTKMLNGVETSLASSPLQGVTMAAGTRLQLHLAATTANGATTLQASAWVDGASEPSNWLLSASDAQPELQGAGSVGVLSYLSGSATAPVNVSFDNITVR